MTSYRVVLTSPFKSCVRQLGKRYPNVKNDVRVAINALLQEPRLGVVIPGGSGVRKLRVRNSDARKGKSSGHRLLNLVEEHPKPALRLIFLYSKSDREDVTRQELQELLLRVKEEIEGSE